MVMPFWGNLEKRSDPPKPTVSREEWAQVTLQLMQLFQKREKGDESARSQILELVEESLRRFDPDTIRLQLEEAKRVKSPATLFIDASPITEAISGRTHVAYSGADDLKERVFSLAIADHNLHCYSELHRQAGDVLFTAGKFPEALDHYYAVLRYRPRYSYSLRDQAREVETPPELQGYQWPQIEDRNTNRMYNIRLMPLSLVEGQMLAFFYAKLGRCLSLCGQGKNTAEQAFRISVWFLDKLGARADGEIIVTVHSEMAKFLFETGNFPEAIAHYENVVSTLSQMTGSEIALASALIDLGEAYLKAGRTESGFERIHFALNIARRLRRQDLVTKAETLLNKKQA